MRANSYTTEELSVLNEVISAERKRGDIKNVQRLLPNRSMGAIYIKLCRLKNKSGGKSWSEEEENRIVQTLHLDRYGDVKKAMRKLLPKRSMNAIYSKRYLLKKKQVDTK